MMPFYVTLYIVTQNFNNKIGILIKSGIIYIITVPVRIWLKKKNLKELRLTIT
jgi:hypothetical protein